MKAVKFGRNWVTKREWLEEYLKKVEEYKQQLKKIKRVESPEELERVITPEKYPEVRPREIPALRFGFVVALLFTLLITGIVFGKDSLVSVFQDLGSYVKKISQTTELAAKEIFKDTKNFYESIPPFMAQIKKNFVEGLKITTENFVREVRILHKNVTFYTYIMAEAPKSSGQLLKDYFSWLGKTLMSIPGKIIKTYSAVTDWLKEKIFSMPRTVLGIIKRAFQRKVSVVEKLPPETEKQITEPEEKIKELAERPPKEIEVERVTRIEPIKEITREVKVLDEKSLKEIKLWLSQQENKLRNLQLAADFGYINLPPVLGLSGGTSVTTLGTITATKKWCNPHVGTTTGSTITIGSRDITFSTNTTFTLASAINSLNIASGLLSFDTSNNRLGVGTTLPVSLLEIYSSTADPKLTVTAASSTNLQIVFRTGATPEIQALIGIDYSSGSNKLKLVRSDDIATSTGLTIDSNGNVGIGTTNPGGGTGNSVLSLYNSSAAPTTLANTAHLYSSAGEGYWIDAAGNAKLQTSHDPETGEWIFSSHDINNGKTLLVRMGKLTKDLDIILDGGYVFENDQPYFERENLLTKLEKQIEEIKCNLMVMACSQTNQEMWRLNFRRYH